MASNLVGPLMRIARRTVKLSQSKLAEMAGVGLKTIQRYEAGLSEPTASTLLEIADGLEYPIQWFVQKPVTPDDDAYRRLELACEFRKITKQDLVAMLELEIDPFQIDHVLRADMYAKVGFANKLAAALDVRQDWLATGEDGIDLERGMFEPSLAIGDRLREARVAAGMSYSELTDASGIDSVESIEAHEKPALGDLKTLAATLRVRLEWLEFGHAPRDVYDGPDDVAVERRYHSQRTEEERAIGLESDVHDRPKPVPDATAERGERGSGQDTTALEWDNGEEKIRAMLDMQTLIEGKHYRRLDDGRLVLLLPGATKLTATLGLAVTTDEPTSIQRGENDRQVDIYIKGSLLRQSSGELILETIGEASNTELGHDLERLDQKDWFATIRIARILATRRMRISLILDGTPAGEIFSAGEAHPA